MTKEEIINRIDAAISEMQALKSEVLNIPEENDDNSVPDYLDFKNAESVYYVTTAGLIGKAQFRGMTHSDTAALNKRLFKSIEYAEDFRRKSQFIADLLHFKWLYDKDFVPEYETASAKYYVFYHHGTGEYLVSEHDKTEVKSQVYFSSGEIAQKCADWLNRRKDRKQ